MSNISSNDLHQLKVQLSILYNVDEKRFGRFWEIIGGDEWNNNTTLYYDTDNLYFDKEKKTTCIRKQIIYGQYRIM